MSLKDTTKARHKEVLDLLEIEMARLPADISSVSFNMIYRKVARQTGGKYTWHTVKKIANTHKEKEDA